MPQSGFYGDDLARIQAIACGGDAAAAAPEIIRRLRSAAIPVRRVIDAGCGAGSLSKALVDAGFEVTGIDLSAALIAAARREAPGASFIEGSIYETALPECEAVLAIGEPLTYHDDPQNADNKVRAFFERAAAAIPTGGLLIFDAIETGEPLLDGRVWRAGEDWAILAQTAENRIRGTLTRDIHTFVREGDLYRRSREIHRVRVFERAALLGWLDAAGFTAETSARYGGHALLPRRCAFFAVKGSV